MRLHELAKEIGVSSKELLNLAREIGLNIKSHSSNLAAGEESILRIATKQEMEEKAEEEAKKAAAEAEKKRAEQEKVAAADAEKAGIEPGVEQQPEEEPEQAVATLEPEAPLSDAEEADTEAAPEEGTPEDVTPAVAASAAEATEEAPETGEDKTKPRLKKPPPRRPGATILGRIDLKPIEEAKKKARAKDARPADGTDRPPVAPGAADKGTPLIPGRPAAKQKEDEALDAKAAKIKKFIKPKLQATFFDPEDDPLLQGIRIRHWNKQARPRRSGWRPGGRGRKKLRRMEPIVHKKVAIVPPVSIKELSQVLGIKAQELLVSLMKKGVMAHINYMLDEEALLQIAMEFDREIDVLEEEDLERDFLEEQEVGAQDESELELRAPIVTFLGHVDHGKTSLLDAIRTTNVAASEDGGITQHVSAYKVKTPSGQSVVFLDTPGHRAFTEMRARGANTTDIVVLVVAADDGVMPQTEEAIQHAQAAGVPIVVAINKVDKANANPMRVKQQLAGQGVMTEDWGGEVGAVEVSATTRQGLDELLDRLALEAEIQELRGNSSLNAQGVVFEARKDVEVGNVVTLLVQDGSLHVRDFLLAGDSMCRIRAMVDDQGRSVEEVGPSTPVNVFGFSTLPEAGDRFMKVENAAKAREIADLRKEKQRQERFAPTADQYAITLENLFESIEAGKVTEICVVLKADVKGTLEVLRRSLSDMKHEEVKVKLLRDGLGDITEDDVLLAVASDAVVIGFHVLPDEKARKLADENNVEIRTYRVIYQLIDDLRLAMEGALAPLKKEKVTAHLEIRQVFKSSRLGNIAGCAVLDGTIHRNNRVRIKRGEEVVYEGELTSLKRFKDDVREVKEGFECGVTVAGYEDVREGDVIESYEIVEEKRTLELE